MAGYFVTKRINGRNYLYLQQSTRVGRRVKTKCKYIGPVSTNWAPVFSSVATTPEDSNIIFKSEISARERREDERIQYGKLSDRIKRQKAAVRRAKRNTKGIKSVNPFIAQGIKRDDTV